MSLAVLSNQSNSPQAVLARNLRAAREILELTQAEVAEAAQVSRATLAQLEAGTGDPRFSTLIEVAAALGVPPLLLLFGRSEVQALAALHDNAAALDSLPQDDVDRVRATVESAGEGWISAARLGANAARDAGCTAGRATLAAGLFTPLLPGAGTAVGAALGLLLK